MTNYVCMSFYLLPYLGLSTHYERLFVAATSLAHISLKIMTEQQFQSMETALAP